MLAVPVLAVPVLAVPVLNVLILAMLVATVLLLFVALAVLMVTVLMLNSLQPAGLCFCFVDFLTASWFVLAALFLPRLSRCSCSSLFLRG